MEHVFLLNGLKNSMKIGKDFKIEADVDKLYQAILLAEDIMNKAKLFSTQGYIIQKKEERPNSENIEVKEYFYSNQEFHPLLYEQHQNMPYQQFESFNQAADEFYSAFEGQKIEMRALQREREAMKKLENVKKDHTKRIEDLEKTQLEDRQKAELITRNQELVEKAIFAVQAALANQVYNMFSHEVSKPYLLKRNENKKKRKYFTLMKKNCLRWNKQIRKRDEIRFLFRQHNRQTPKNEDFEY
ncbi:hypothetical protein AMK59_2316 [Oryctes borbonicus]|uniref:Uncharacterized protein n=1 Tax=Oryctes borbonicus TaxID=1629725 RepID=A0A0T6BBR1_9SCAR|nr:hypothetical protein AMK59_2316 [Oryctes borbonicus]